MSTQENFRFNLPSQGFQGHALAHGSGKVTLSVMSASTAGVYFALGSLTPGEARAVGEALIAAADRATAMADEQRAATLPGLQS